MLYKYKIINFQLFGGYYILIKYIFFIKNILYTYKYKKLSHESTYIILAVYSCIWYLRFYKFSKYIIHEYIFINFTKYKCIGFFFSYLFYSAFIYCIFLVDQFIFLLVSRYIKYNSYYILFVSYILLFIYTLF